MIERFVAADRARPAPDRVRRYRADTPTGGRVARLAPSASAKGRFCATYADGVADVDLGALLDFHDGHGALATMTVVRPHLQWGVAEIDADGRVAGFAEKPRSEHWVNGGFFCFEPGALDYIDPDSVLEREPLARLAAAGELRAYRHEGFWDCMDTYKDAVVLDDLWSRGERLAALWGRVRRRTEAPWSPAPTGSSARIWHRRCSNAATGCGSSTVPIPARRTSAGRAARPSTCSGSATRSSSSRPTSRRRGGRGGRRRLRLGLPPRGADDRRHRPPLARSRPSRSTCAAPGTSSRRAANTASERVVFASSDKAYGASAELPYREDFPLRAAFPYDASKAAADIIARSYARAYGLPLAVTRFANVYGGGDLNFTRLIPETAIAVIEGRPPAIRSDGSPERDFLHVDDAVAAYLAIEGALASGDGEPGAAGEAFNAGGERPHAVREVVGLIAELAGGGVEPEFRGAGNPDGEIDRQYVDSSKLRERTGWRPSVELRDGLRRTLEWYRDHPEARY